MSRFHLWNASLLMPLWLPTLDAIDTESLLSWQQAPASEEAAALPQAPPQQPEEGSDLDDGAGVTHTPVAGSLEGAEEPCLRPLHRTRASTVAQAAVMAATNALVSSPTKRLRRNSPRKYANTAEAVRLQDNQTERAGMQH